MSLIGILIVLIIIGAVLYVIRILPIEPFVKNLAYVLVAVFALIWLLKVLVGNGIDLRI